MANTITLRGNLSSGGIVSGRLVPKKVTVKDVLTVSQVIDGNLNPQEQIRGGDVQKGQGSTVDVISKTTEEWRRSPQEMSKKNCIYVYSDYRIEDGVKIPRIKIGDGMSYVVDLPFSTMSITEEDIERWNDHVGVYVDEESHNMIFYH